MEQNQDNLTDPTLSGAAHVDASDGQAAVADTLSLTELNSILGKDFKDKATALKAVKDTFSYVGRKSETPQAPASADPRVEAALSSLKEQVFYANNPQFKGHESIIKAMGSDPAEVVNLPAFKTYLEKATVADEVAKTKSVVNSNQRVAQNSTMFEDAVKVANSGAGGTRDNVAEVLAKGIIDELGLTI